MTLSLQQLGDGLGMSKQAASKHVSRGMPRESIEAAQDWYKRNKNPAQRKRQPPGPSTDTVDKVDRQAPRVASDESFEQARTRKQIADANIAEMEAKEKAGLLIRTDAIEAAEAKKAAAVRESLLQFPSQLAPVVAAEGSIERCYDILTDAVMGVLAKISGKGA